MGLHNRYPRYFYKRGNLLNTYLGHTNAPQAPAPARRKPVPTTRREPSPQPAAGPKLRVRDTSAQRRLADFAKEHMSEDEAADFVRLLADDLGVPARPDPPVSSIWIDLERLVTANLPRDRAERFLGVLIHRRAAGWPLIDPNRR